MPVIPVQCMICGNTLPDDISYLNHMKEKHGTTHPDEAMQRDKMIKANTPKTTGASLPPGIRPEDLPTPEFMETVREMDAHAPPMPVSTTVTTAEPLAPLKPRVAPLSPQTAVTPPKSEAGKIELAYVYKGSDEKGHAVETIMIEAEKALYAVAYCIVCHKDVKKMKVHPITEEKTKLKSDTITVLSTGHPDIDKKVKKEEKHGK